MQYAMLGIAGILMIIGAIIGFDVFGKLRNKVKNKFTKISEEEAKNNKLSELDRKKTISEKVGYYNGKRGFYVTEQAETARQILVETGRANEYMRTIIVSGLLAVAGATIGFVLNNFFATILLAAGGFMIPFWRLKLYRNKYRKYLACQLEGTTSIITTSYIRNNNIVAAVEENLTEISPLIRPYFKEFVAETKLNASVKNCVRNLRDKINDSTFHEWCETLLRTLDDAEMKESLLPICQKYSAVRIVQEEIDIEVANAVVEYLVMMAMSLLAYPMVYLLNKDWFAYYNTFIGQLVVGYTLVIVFYSIVKLIAAMQPVQYRK